MRNLAILVAVTAVKLHTCLALGSDPTACVPVCRTIPRCCVRPSLNGRLVVIDHQLKASIDHLNEGDLESFTTAAHNLVSAFDGASSDIQSACQEAGYTLARLKHASLLLANGQERDLANGQALEPATQEVTALRDKLLQQLADDHKHYTTTTDAVARDLVRGRMESTLQQVEQLNEVVKAAEQSNGLQLPLGELQQLLEGATQAVDTEREMLVTQSQTLSVIVTQAFGCMDTALRVRTVSSGFPDEQIRKLRDTRRSLVKLIDLSRTAHGVSNAVAKNAVRRVPKDTLSDGLLQRVQRVLGHQAPTSPSTASR